MATITQPDPASLVENLDLEVPLVGLYDAPDPKPFEPLVRPGRGRGCIFSSFASWRKGETLHLTADAFGCRGAGSCLLGLETRSDEDLVEFLVEGEGLKRSREAMTRWVERREVYRPRHAHILVGPLRWDQYEHLRSVTFFVDPDQLSALVVGAHYDCGPDDPPPVSAPFGSGCLQLLPPPGDPQVARAVIGATDPAMRAFLPPATLAFTVNRTMFGRLCALDERSFLHKSFWRNLCRARGRE